MKVKTSERISIYFCGKLGLHVLRIYFHFRKSSVFCGLTHYYCGVCSNNNNNGVHKREIWVWFPLGFNFTVVPEPRRTVYNNRKVKLEWGNNNCVEEDAREELMYSSGGHFVLVRHNYCGKHWTIPKSCVGFAKTCHPRVVFQRSSFMSPGMYTLIFNNSHHSKLLPSCNTYTL